MKKVEVRFLNLLPDEPGQYLVKKAGVINLIEVQQRDLDQHKEDGQWLTGLGVWGPKLVEVGFVVSSCEPSPPLPP